MHTTPTMKLLDYILLFTYLYLCFHVISSQATDTRKPYIVYMGEVQENVELFSTHEDHHNILTEAIGDELIATNSRIHSYGRSFNGFVANLLPNEADILAKRQGIVSVFPNTLRELYTTHSWDFIGLAETVKREQHVESDVIVALLDTGIDPSAPSFNPAGFGPPPAKWKGTCDTGKWFPGCNNKVIGARVFDVEHAFNKSQLTPMDIEGHGTHTASTAAGVVVKGASLYGLGEGTARGAVPSARIASYKTCAPQGCWDADILAAFDAAIADGVDIISASLGGRLFDFFTDAMTIGSFHALKKGILTVAAAGNDGPSPGSVSNVAPWILTVAASTSDRVIQTDVKLGNGELITGTSINTISLGNKLLPLTNGAKAMSNHASPFANISNCDDLALDPKKVKGKIAYCQGAGGDGISIHPLGGLGAIMSYESVEVAFPTGFPATYVSIQDGLKIDKYINTTKSPQGIIYPSKIVKNTSPYPVIARFSSRGPQGFSQIIKPDLAAPGVNILAGYTKFAFLSPYPWDKRVVKLNFLSGTSMATPHVSGVAAYIKSFHPQWSPAAIKSAMMTTATPMKIQWSNGAFASGSGNIDPIAALNPGFVYDMNENNYISFLCREGYRASSIGILTGKVQQTCNNYARAKGIDGLNYPSFHYQLKPQQTNFTARYHRTVTNVATGSSVYKVTVKAIKGLSVTVTPSTLTFDKLYQKQSFVVTLRGEFSGTLQFLSGTLVWSDGTHNVKSPILVYRPLSNPRF